MEPWAEKLTYTLVAVVVPVGIILGNAYFNFAGILLTIGLTAWVGAALTILTSLLGEP